jgi:DNA (cytosine-5)-methyltransferase 1
MNELSLFSGYGGFSLGLRAAGINSRTIGWCDNDKYVQKIIRARIKDGYLDDAPVIGDIRSFNWELYRGLVDIITAGFPCQPHSQAGKGAGEADARNLWPDTRRCISEVRPRWVLLENVPGIVANGYAGTVVGELSELGYDATWGIVSAETAGAPHLRQRWWCLAELAYSFGGRFEQRQPEAEPQTWLGEQGERNATELAYPIGNAVRAKPRGMGATTAAKSNQMEQRQWAGSDSGHSSEDEQLAYSYSERLQGVRSKHNSQGWEEPNGQARLCSGTDLSEDEQLADSISKRGCSRDSRGEYAEDAGQPSRCTKPGWWDIEPNVGRVAHGVTSRVDRLKAIGNGIVPAVVAEFLRRIGQAHIKEHSNGAT